MKLVTPLIIKPLFDSFDMNGVRTSHRIKELDCMCVKDYLNKDPVGIMKVNWNEKLTAVKNVDVFCPTPNVVILVLML